MGAVLIELVGVTKRDSASALWPNGKHDVAYIVNVYDIPGSIRALCCAVGCDVAHRVASRIRIRDVRRLTCSGLPIPKVPMLNARTVHSFKIYPKDVRRFCVAETSFTSPIAWNSNE